MAQEKITKEEKKVLSIWASVVVVLVVVLLILNHFFPIKTLINSLYGKNTEIINKYTIIGDYSRYSTVSGALQKYYSFVNAKDYDSVIKILNEEYVKDNKITKDNIEDFISFPDDKYVTFDPNIMYRKSLKEGVYSYIMDGEIEERDTGDVLGKTYYQVILDGNTFLFSVKPLTEEEYGGLKNE